MPGVVRTPRTALPSLRLWWPSEVRFTISDLAGPELCYEETAAQFNSTLGAAVLKGAGSYLAGMAVAIPILNVDGRRHTNNFSKNI